MAGQTEADTRAVDESRGAGQSEQADTGATGAAVPERRDGAPESRAPGSAKDEARPADTRVSEFEYRIKKLEREVGKMRKVFLDHTHETLSDTPPPAVNSSATSGDAGSSGVEAEAVKPAIAEKPPTQTKEREEKRKEATQQYFTRIHRHKRHARAGVDD